MSTRAVTQDASAASSQIEDALETGFLPDDLTYRKTGRFEEKPPAKEEASAASEETEEQEEEDQEHADTEEASAASKENADTAAASAAAETQKKEVKGPERSKFPKTSAQRWREREAELRDLREKVARLEGRAEASAERSDTKQGSQPAAEAKKGEAAPRPKIDDVDPKTGKPKYSSYAEYEAAKDEWLQKDAIRQFQETSEKTAREQQFAQARERIQQEVTKRVTQARKDHPDYDEVCAEGIAAKDDQGRDLIYIPEGSHLDLFLLESPRGQDVIYELSKNLDQHAHIFARDAKGNFLMTAVRQIRELSRIEAALEGAKSSASSNSSSSSAKPVTRAPRPPEQVSGKGTVAKDAVEKAVEEQDQDTYAREQNARDPRLAALRRSRGK